LRAKGAAVVRISARDFPAFLRASTWLDSERPARMKVARGNTVVDFGEVDTVWFRRLRAVTLDAKLETAGEAFARDETLAYLYSVGAMLEDRFCVNPLISSVTNSRGRGKIRQLERARKVGMSIPRSLATNEPREAQEFVRSCKLGAIYKVMGGAPPWMGEPNHVAPTGIYTTKLDASAFEDPEQRDRVRYAPCLFQELVPKRLDVRATVIGSRVFSTEIHSQVHAQAAVDFRRGFELKDMPYAIHAMPRELEEKCVRLNRDLGIVFGAYDFVLTPDGRYVFLEVNEQGQFLWLEQITGQPLLENLCELLIQRRPDFVCDAPVHEPGPLPPAPPTDEYDVFESE
jgi:glutathione synthase/RimK-type ligase-like ATP-grasp enzyme